MSDPRESAAVVPEAEPLGAILAGGEGRRIGGSKAIVQLAGRPLIAYALRAMRAALEDVVVIAKHDTELPRLSAGSVWIERERLRHPLVGILEAVELAGGRRVLVCAADLPLVTPPLIRRIATAGSECDAAVAALDGVMQPLLACYSPTAAESMRREPHALQRPLRELVAARRPRLVAVEDADELFNVNAPEDLPRAAAILDRRREISRT